MKPLEDSNGSGGGAPEWRGCDLVFGVGLISD